LGKQIVFSAARELHASSGSKRSGAVVSAPTKKRRAVRIGPEQIT
jgi:hypothetical protein